MKKNIGINKVLVKAKIAFICCIAIATLLFLRKHRVRKTQRRKQWVREIIRTRKDEGAYALLRPKLMSDHADYRNYLRISKESFKYVLNLIEPKLLKQNTNMRLQCITVRERLAVTLRYLATGNF